jgi:nucleotide-binding universal stress UspA family protein
VSAPEDPPVPDQPLPSPYVVVAADASPHSLAALRAAAQLAEALGLELRVLYVEDINLFHLAGLPFSHEVGSFTAAVRLLDSAAVERQFHQTARRIQRAAEHVAALHRLTLTFTTARGRVPDEIEAAAQAAALIGLGRTGRIVPARTGARPRLGSTARYMLGCAGCPLLIAGDVDGLRPPFALLYTDTPAAQRALDLAVRLALHHEGRLDLLLAAGDAQAVEVQARALQDACAPGQALDLTLEPLLDPARLARRVAQLGSKVLLLPADASAHVVAVDLAVIVVP